MHFARADNSLHREKLLHSALCFDEYRIHILFASNPAPGHVAQTAGSIKVGFNIRKSSNPVEIWRETCYNILVIL
jgi:hypothetical protein